MKPYKWQYIVSYVKIYGELFILQTNPVTSWYSRWFCHIAHTFQLYFFFWDVWFLSCLEIFDLIWLPIMKQHPLTCLKPSPLIGWELILVKSPQEGPETCHFLLKLGARDWLGQIQPGGLVWKDERRVVQEALKDIWKRSKWGQEVKRWRNDAFDDVVGCDYMNFLVFCVPPLSSVPGGGAHDAGGALAGPSL